MLFFLWFELEPSSFTILLLPGCFALPVIASELMFTLGLGETQRYETPPLCTTGERPSQRQELVYVWDFYCELSALLWVA